MNGQEWLDKLPELPSKVPGQGRDKCVLDAVESGLMRFEFATVKSTLSTGETAIFSVTADAGYVVLDDGSRFRPMCSAWLQQKVADLIPGQMLPTAKIMDLSYNQAPTKLDAVTLPAGAKMVTKSYSFLYNNEFEKRRAGRTGLIRDSGKSWILSNKLGYKKGFAVNHGFYSKQTGGRNLLGDKLYQNEGNFHDALHQDYSQTIILMSSQCLLNNELVDVKTIMTDKRLCGLLSYSGPLLFTRQPGV